MPEQPTFDQERSCLVHRCEQTPGTSSLRTNSSMLTSAERFIGANFSVTKGQNDKRHKSRKATEEAAA